MGHRKRRLQKHRHLKEGKIEYPQRDGKTRGRRADGKIRTFLKAWFLKERGRRDELRKGGYPLGRRQSCGRKIKQCKKNGLKPECHEIWSLRTVSLKKAVYQRAIRLTGGPKIGELQKGGKTGRRRTGGSTAKPSVDGRTENPSPHSPETDGKTGNLLGEAGRKSETNGHPKEGWTKAPGKHGETERLRQDRPKTDGPKTNRHRPGSLKKPLFPRWGPGPDSSHATGGVSGT